MTLGQMYQLANAKSGYSRSDLEVYDALDEAGFRVYTATVKEFGGFFLKFDEVSLTLVPGTTEYTLPADLTQIVHLAERVDSTQNWEPIAPMDIDSALTNIQQTVGWSDFYSDGYGTGSAFGFFGPYLDSTNTQNVGAAAQLQKIRIAPNPDQNRFVQIAYTAKWLPITTASSKIMLPDEGTRAQLNYASAILCAGSDDSRAAYYEKAGDNALSSYLYWVRARQIMSPLTIETYGPGY